MPDLWYQESACAIMKVRSRTIFIKIGRASVRSVAHASRFKRPRSEAVRAQI